MSTLEEEEKSAHRFANVLDQSRQSGFVTKRDLPIQVSPTLNEILHTLARQGSPGLIVGGAVRDAMLGASPKDLDIEVYHCNPSEAPIWMGDLSFKSISDVCVGDQVIGWSTGEYRDQLWGGGLINRKRISKSNRGLNRPLLTTSTVTGIHKTQSEIVKVTFESGRTLRCTPDHKWLHRYGCAFGTGKHAHHRNDSKWVKISKSEIYGPPLVGHVLTHVVEPTSNDFDSRKAGWLGGIYDGEGNGFCIAQCSNHNPEVYEYIHECLLEFGIPHSPLTSGNSGWRITGGRQSFLQFINTAKPVKKEWFVKYILGKLDGKSDRIISVEPDGYEPVYALQTTTGNYVAWGYASKNSTLDNLAAKLNPYGNVDLVGKAFGVLKVRTPDGEDYDFSVPRRDNKIGSGHKDFQVTFDPNITPAEAAARRDFTFNSMAYDPVSHELHDYYGGEQDLKNKVLRATSPAFMEDSLRVLRGMQIICRMPNITCKKCGCGMIKK